MKSGKRKAEGENPLQRATSRAAAGFGFAIPFFCRWLDFRRFNFRFPLSAFRFCL